MRSLFTLLLACFAIVAGAQVWDGTATTWTKGDGSKANPYLIENPAHLAYLSQTVTRNEGYEGKYFKLANALDMGASQGHTFNPIGEYNETLNPETMLTEDNSAYFKGTFDGNNKVIRNLKVQMTKANELGGTGFFAAIIAPAHIHNVIFSDNVTVEGEVLTGGLVAHMKSGTVEKIVNKGTVIGTIVTGGVIGSVENGSVQAVLRAGKTVGTTDVGGVAGATAGKAVVASCINIGAVEALSYGGGGIVGTAYDNSAINGCYNTGRITGKSSKFVADPHAVVSSLDGQSTMSNNFYVPEKSGVDDPHATAKSLDELKTEAVLSELNKGLNPPLFVKDEQGIMGGNPIFAWVVEAVATSIDKVVADGAAVHYQLDGKVLLAPQRVAVFSLDGSWVGEGTRVELPAAGVYVVKAGTKATKVLVD